jgi:two-component system, cell cycle response regulator
MDSTKSKVLVVDDDPAMLRMLSRWLDKEGYSTQVASDGLLALSMIETDCPDFVITDWEMPNMDGLELCRRVRALDLPHYVFIMFLTVKSASEEMIKGLEIGADEFLCKPVAHEELLARMRAGSRVLELERKLNLMAHTDPLTGLLTQRTFYDIMSKEWHRAMRNQLPLSCVMMDLDFFKRINDIQGHQAGDVVLKKVAEMLLKYSRRSDSVCRYGGDEFCILLPETNEADAVAWAERVHSNVKELVIPVGNENCRLCVSFGVSQRHEDTVTPEALVDQADQALLCAKRTGRNCVIGYQSLNEAGELELVTTENDLFKDIEARHVMTPIVVCLRHDQTIKQAVEFFIRSRINSTPIIDAQGKLCGMLSEKDLMASIVSLNCCNNPISSVMRPNVITYEENTPIRTIYEFLCRVAMQRVVIVKDGCPVGAISRGSLLRLYRNLVMGKGLLESDECESSSNDANTRLSRERLEETTRLLAVQVAQLQDQLQGGDKEIMPYVIGGATGMQDLVDDLLTYSQYADSTKNCAADFQYTVAGGNYMD